MPPQSRSERNSLIQQLEAIRELFRQHWSNNPNWREGNEHTYVGQADIIAESLINAERSENRARDPAPLELVTDQEREDNWAGKTGILVRAKLPDGSFGSVDIAELDRASLWTWLRSRGGRNLWAENLILAMLEHKQITESEDAANR